VVLLQATSPLRTGADIDACIRLCHDSGAPAAATVCEVSKSPFWMFTLGTDLRVRRLLDSHPIGNRRQNLPKVYAANGAVYVARPDWLRAAGTFWTDETAGHVMPAERSVDVDSELDFKLAQLLLEG
jgi:CMP-N-acetylneuraminic acid synthetase